MLKKCLFIIGSIAALYGIHIAPNTALPHQSFYFMRHGQTDWNRDNRCMGQIDIPINEDGKVQAHQAAAVLKNTAIDIIVSSPLQRAVQTAAIIAQQLNKPLVIVEDLKECNFGEQQGQPDGDWFTAWKAGTPINGAETFTQFQERVVQGAHIALRLGQCVLIVAHGAVYIALQDYLGLSSDLFLPTGALVQYTPPTADNPHWHGTLLFQNQSR